MTLVNSIIGIPFNFINIFLFLATVLFIYNTHDYLYLYLISIECLIIIFFHHYYNDNKKTEDTYVKEVIELQWLLLLLIFCHLKFCFITIKEELMPIINLIYKRFHTLIKL